MKKVWLAGMFLSLLITGCASGDSAATKEKTGNNVKQVSVDEALAGGKLGSESIAFVGGGTSNKLWVIDAKYHNLVSNIDVGGPYVERTEKDWYPNLNDTHAIAFTKDFKTMFTGNWYNYDKPSYVIAIEPKTMRELWRLPTGKGAHHVSLSPDDKYLYVANQHEETVSVIDLATKTKIKDLHTGKGTCYLTPTMYWEGKVINAPYLLVSVDKEEKVTAIDWKTNEIVKDIPVGGMVHGLNFTPDGKTAWAAVMGAKKIVVIDVKTLKVTGEIKFEGGPIHISFSPDGKFGYTTSGGEIFKIDVKTHKVIWKAKGTTSPAHTGVTPDGKELWTLNHGMDERYNYTLGGAPVSGVQVWDTETGKLITEIVAEGIPHEIQFVPYSVFAKESEKDTSKGHEGHSGDKKVSAAETTFKNTCSTCHGQDLTGGAGPDISKIGAKLNQGNIQKVIMDGKGMMPSNLLSEDKAKELSTWLSEKK